MDWRRAIPLVLLTAMTGCADADTGAGDPGSSGDPAGGTTTSGAASSTTTSGSETATGETTSTSTSSSPTSTEGSGSTGPATSTAGTTMDETFPGGLIVDVAWLEQYLGNDNLQVIDTRPSPSGEHIAGALHIEPTELATTIDDITAQVMPPDAAASVLSAAGLRNGTTAVVYGNPPEYDAARVTWALHYYGHSDVRYLDGGWDAWEAAGGQTQSGAFEVGPTGYRVTANEELRATGAFVLEQLGRAPYDQPSIGLVDARSPREWDAGRIPSATHVQWTRTLAEDGTLVTDAELEALYADVSPTETIVTYCLVGWRASVAWLTLRHLGFEDVRVYDGSWVEWSGGDFPVEP